MNNADNLKSNGFDSIAFAYRKLETLTHGNLLSRTRNAHISALQDVRQALLIGEGNGQFLNAFLTANRNVKCTIVEPSLKMQNLAKNSMASTDSKRIEWATMSIFEWEPQPNTPFDLIVTHFVFDLFCADQHRQLIKKLSPVLAPTGQWLVSDYCSESTTRTSLQRIRNRCWVTWLYLCFGLLHRFPNNASLPEMQLFADLGYQKRLSKAFGHQLTQSVLFRKRTKTSEQKPEIALEIN